MPLLLWHDQALRMALRQAISSAVRAAQPRVAMHAQQQPRRAMSGNMGVHKNKFVEEWSGRREVTEKAFRLDSKTVPQLGLWLVVPFSIMFYAIKAEQVTQDTMAGKDGDLPDRYF